MNKKDEFPKGFLWGAATASYQVEGGIYNCDWAQAATEGKVPVCGEACDHYNRFVDDFDIAKSLGHNTHRISVEWARIEPKEGEFDAEVIEHYRDVLRALHERSLKPLVTIYHFTLPLWFSEGGGWERKDAVKKFSQYAQYVVQELGDLCDNFVTINEPLVLASIGYVRGAWPPLYKNNFLRYLKVTRQLADAHNSAYKAIKEINPHVDVGIVKHMSVYEANWNPFNRFLAWVVNRHWTYSFMNKVCKHSDFIGVNYYRRRILGDTRELQKTDMGWTVDPEGIYSAIRMLDRYKLPIYISEAGCADAKDKFRADYIRDTVVGILQALNDGADVRGFCYWSLLDNYEWSEGFDKKFGLVEVNYDTQERTIRPSAHVYKELISHYSK